MRSVLVFIDRPFAGVAGGGFVAMVVDPALPGTSRRSQRRNDCLLKDRRWNYFAPALDRGTIERRIEQTHNTVGLRSDA
jgi:hypothetical protein